MAELHPETRARAVADAPGPLSRDDTDHAEPTPFPDGGTVQPTAASPADTYGGRPASECPVRTTLSRHTADAAPAGEAVDG